MLTRRISLLGSPSVVLDGAGTAGRCGRKAWGVLAFVALAERPPTRQRLGELLFADAEDPLRALRWNLTQLRRVLGDADVIIGDPLELRLSERDVLDVELVLAGRWPEQDADWPGGELLEGLNFDASPGFAAWLDLERHHLRGATVALLVELAVARRAEDDHRVAARLALRAVALDELNAGHHALLVRSLLDAGDEPAAREHVARCARLFRERLDAPVPDEVEQALRRTTTRPLSPPAEIAAALESGRAAIAAGAVKYGLDRLREAVALTDGRRDALRAQALLGLSAALLHNTGDRSVACAAGLQEASIIAQLAGERLLAAEAARELGFLHVQIGQHARAEAWLGMAEQLTADPVERSRIHGVQGMCRSDQRRDRDAFAALEQSVELANAAAARRSEAWSRTLIGRLAVLRGDFDEAERVLQQAAALVARERWTAFAPWVQAFQAEVELARGDRAAAGERLERAHAAARTIGDHCWISMTARGLARVRVAAGDLPGALDWIHEALRPTPWYVWVYAYCLTAAVEIAEAAEAGEGEGWQRELALVNARAQLFRAG